ncbi:MAG: retropepsin-like aspartic protease [Niameybacter sp.]|uniref:retropepsin-like aspartic protease n=1 Tax=Niameybacter sp. TaxID=2033640 RepID=UPI002FCB3070
MSKCEIKMEPMGNMVMLDLELWSKRVNRFRNMMVVFDTGASVTIISKDILYQLGYDVSNCEKARITTASGVAYVDIVRIERLKIGQFILEDVEVYAHTFPEESFSVGVIGLNVIANYRVTLDFELRKIVCEQYK